MPGQQTDTGPGGGVDQVGEHVPVEEGRDMPGLSRGGVQQQFPVTGAELRDVHRRPVRRGEAALDAQVPGRAGRVRHPL
ncbi:hypothetical protein [Streptomyces sp. NPDC058572]|uniref:hypothetical protein n=1 Tax=Streptomyces sp. NPDC058572 TaxID=3346546 RepID=UPI00365DC282